MRIFITGAGGFIGSCIAEYLSRRGYETAIYKRSKDGNLSPDGIPENVDVIVNSAGRLGTPDVDSTELMLSNATLPKMLADHCSKKDIHLIHISTPGVTGLSANASEDSEYNPWGEYESSKMVGEINLREHEDLPADRLTVLRPDFVYGIGDLHKLALFKQVSKGWMPLIGRNGAKIRPTFAGDVCRAVESALPGGILNGGLFNIAGPDIVTVRELSSEIASALGQSLRIIHLPKVFFRIALNSGKLCPDALSESRFQLFGKDHYVSTEKAEKADFYPEWDIKRGIGETVSWYLKNGILP